MRLFHDDCLRLMPSLPAASIDLVLCDLPYGCTRNAWDSPIDTTLLWKEYRRLLKPNGVVVLTSQGKFSAIHVMEAEDLYRYTLIWRKNKPRGFLNAKRQPLRAHEDILVFYKKQPTYNPQKTKGHSPVHSFTKHSSDGTNYGKTKLGVSGGGSTERYPTSVIDIPVVNKPKHPTQKPLALGEWLIRTYSNPGDLVLDNTAGSGTFLVAAAKTGRDFIGMELSEEYVELIVHRLKDEASVAMVKEGASWIARS